MSDQLTLTPRQRDDLRTIAAMIIPPSEEYRVPGADDDIIQADILATLGRDTKQVVTALDHLSQLAGMPLADLEPAARDGVAQQFRNSGVAAATLVRVVLQCYYRDDRVLRSLGLELRAPFPKGHVLPDGDWSLLDPVKARGGSLRRTS